MKAFSAPSPFLEAGADDVEIAAGAVSVAWGYGFKQTGDGFPGLYIREGQAARVQVAFLAQSDRLFDLRMRSLGLGPGACTERRAIPFRGAHLLAKRGPQGLKPKSFLAFYGPTKVVP